ncbi:MAG: glycoside-pentoside-hexuronide (GPH):cation symporter [Lachnospiraceae bacterium]|nr:glycoside-pentoside-hexuronide (GPH):cation symporter [Lachnospiraceae bacterium]MDE7273429.1 glycoside-pentoside-hexuronide (GPH):cation symporter [Lachnospiraceae bacterium]
MNEKKYLKWYQKVAYGSGDMASNCGYALISSFMLLYLTTAVGLNSLVIGNLMMASKLLDGVSDIFFGGMMDKTKSKMGQARPWMLFGQIGVSASLFLVFAIPSMSETMQYAYFFVFYTAFNAIFYTANSIAYSSLAAKITKNGQERVQLGSIRFIFATFTTLVVSYNVMGLVERFGGGAKGWRMVALVFAVIALVVNTFSVLMVKEVPDEDAAAEQKPAESEQKQPASEKVSFGQSLKLLLKNPYYILILGLYLVNYVYSGITQGVGIFFMTYYMGDPALLGTFSLVSLVPVMLILMVTPALVKKFGTMRKMNLYARIVTILMGILFLVGALNKNLPVMLIAAFFRNMAGGPLTGTLNALVAETSDYTYRTQKVRIDGVMFSCSSIGVKLGGGIGSAVVGWLLAIGGFDGTVDIQPASAVNMIFFMYAVIPIIFGLFMALLIYLLKVEDANRKWDSEHAAAEGGAE